MSMTDFLRFVGFLSAGHDAFNDENGKDSTPRNGAGSTATDAAESPRPAIEFDA